MKSKKLKIAMILDNPFSPDLRVLKEAQSLVKQGHEVTIYAWDRDRKSIRPNSETIDGINIVRIEAKSDRQMGIRQIPRYIYFAYRAISLTFRGSYDVVHCHDLPDLLIGVLIKIFKKIHLVYDAHEIYWVMEAKKYPKFILSFIRRGEFYLIRKVDAFITVGLKRAEYYRPHYHKPIFVVGNWYNPMSQSVDIANDLRHSLGIPKDDFIVTYAGTLAKVRGVNLLIDIAKIFYEHYSNIHLVVAGAGPAYDLFAESSTNNSNLHFLGWLEDVSPVFSASNALIYLMDFSHPYAQYNSPNTLYLSIAWGLPLVGIKAGEISIILSSVEHLLLDNLNVDDIVDKVNHLYNDRDYYEAVQRQFVSLQSEYNWSRAEELLISAYDTLQM